MAQTLAALPALNNPPGITESNTLMKDVAALANLSNKQLLALRVWFKVVQLAAESGTDYTADIPLLIQSSQNLFGSAWNVTQNPWAGDPSGRWEAALDWNDAYQQDNTISTDVDTLVGEARVLMEYSDGILYQAFLFLRYKLGF